MSDWWTGRPWRMIQTNLREIDMIDIDAGRYVADLQSFAANVVLINTAGIIASYPTDLPFHTQSPFLQGDSLAEIIDACHEADIRVLARTDFSKVRRPLYEEHPEWAYRTREGKIVDYHGDVHVCINGEYQQVYALKIIEEALTRLPLDGIFFNMGGYQTRDYSGNYYGICHCQSCQRSFRERHNLSLPTAEDMADPVYRAYRLFQRETVAEHRQKVHDLIVSIRPDVAIANHGELGRGFVRQESNTAIERPLPHWQYSASDNTKWVVSSYPDLVCSNTSVDFIDFPYRHVAVSPHQQKLRLAQNLAQGGALDYYLIGRLDNHEDRTGFAPVKAMFRYHADHEQEYVGLRSCAPIALLNGPDANVGEFRGWFRFLSEHHYLFDTLMVEVATERPWDRYAAIILPDYRPLSDALLARLDAFAEAGGTVIAVGQSGFLDERFQPRAQPPLRCLGMERVRMVRDDMRSSYFRVDDHADYPRLADTDLVYMDGSYVYADYGPSAHKSLRLIPPHPFGPPERCYYTQVTHEPGVIVHPYGAGRGLTIPWNPGVLFHRQGYPNTYELIGDVVQNAAGLEPLGGNLPPMVEATVLEQEASSNLLLHLVNGAGHFGVSFYAPPTMHDLTVVVPLERQVVRAHSLVTGEDYRYEQQEGRMTVEVPRLELFEAIKLICE